MKLIFYRDLESGKLFQFQRLPESMTENEVDVAIFNANNDPNTKSRIEKVEIDEYGEFLLKNGEEKQLYSAECVQEALDALDDAIDCIRCLRTVKE